MQSKTLIRLSLIALPLLLAGCGNQSKHAEDSSSMVSSNKNNSSNNVNSSSSSSVKSSGNTTKATTTKPTTPKKNANQPLPNTLTGSYTTTLNLKVQDMNNKPIGNAIVPVVLHVQKNKVYMGTGKITATGSQAAKLVKTMNKNMFNSNPGYADITNVKVNGSNQATAKISNDMGLYDITDTEYYNGNINFNLSGNTLNAEIEAGNATHGAKAISLASGIISVLTNTNNNSNFYNGNAGSFTKVSDEQAKALLSANKQFIKGYGY